MIGRRFYRALTNIAHSKRLEKIATAEAYNADKPPAKRRRVPYWKPSEIADDESSDTASSTDDDLPPYYLRSEKIVPHGLQHFTEQVKMGGSHGFHDNDMQESTHKRNIARAGERARTYLDVNDSSTAMMDFLIERQLLEEICVRADVVEDDTESGYTPQDITHRTLPTGHYPQDITHRTLPTGHYPQDITHRTLPTGHCPQDITHRTLPTGHYPQDIAHRTLPTSTHVDDGDDSARLNGFNASVSLSCVIQSREKSILRLKRGSRGIHITATQIHHDTWDIILCAGAVSYTHLTLPTICSV